MSFIFKLLLNGLAVYFTAVLLNTLFPGIQPVVLNNYPVAIFVSVVIGLMNRTVRPILKLITFPINIVTLGLFGWIINGIVILLVPYVVNLLVPGGFQVHGLLWAIVYSAVVSFIQSTLNVLVK